MYNKFIYRAVIATAIILFCSCGPTNKDKYLKQFEAFVVETEQNADNYSSKDWEKANDIFEEFTDDWYERFAQKLDNNDKKQVGRYVARYHKVCLTHAIKGFSSAASMLEGYAEEMGENLDPFQQMKQAGISIEEIVEEHDISDLFE